ncbi:V-type H+-transporting ATPase subunit E [Kwoniella heveanensis BCC8398]|uniref:V-type H+-transporting ATPase subunit E n=1 Tax=Kwoniella heveanensis BCC8398 TaxID=1296120 RepID=A0A1B9GHG4_9TREE|nr:V-type H+-transporting ATPase subunit E [Kwoniella heveanensis BCC8398]
MSRSGALDDNEIQTEMNKMVAFISQEAREKAREIQVKADEEFAIEKAKIVRQESLAIDAQYEKKRKQAEVGWKISQSTAINNSRIKILRSRNDHLEAIFDEANKQVKELSEGDKYKEAIENLILEVLLKLLSEKVTLAHRPRDADVVKKATSAAQKRYKELSGRETQVEYDQSLPDDSAGGVIGSSMAGRIKVDNTLGARLTILEEKMLPELRHDLFGPNENRKFYTVSSHLWVRLDGPVGVQMLIYVPYPFCSNLACKPP